MSYTRQWFHKRLRDWTSRYIYAQLYRDRDPDVRKSIVVAGTGRSGTTWLAKIISSQAPCRVMFEPFNPRLVSDYAGFNYFQYKRPADTDDALYAYCQRVFSGTIRHAWIDRVVDTINPEYRVIKEIRSNLFLKWIHQNFPAVPLLFLMRHPCAVVQSRMQLDWATDSDIEPFLSQPDLVDDHLSDMVNVIKKAKTPEQKHAIVWCISNLIPLRQFAEGELTVIFYEYLCTRPETEIPRIFGAIGHTYKSSVFEILNQPSSTAAPHSAVSHGRNRVTRWQSQLSSGQTRDVLSIVRDFGLDYLYGDSPLPLVHEYRSPAGAKSGVDNG